MMTAEEILALINDYLDKKYVERRPESLYEPVRYVLSIGGKRIRPMLMMLAYNLYKEHPEDILPQACGLETYHNYTLLHDDLMDNADLRRGHQTVHTKWDANTAVLSGDSMLVLAYKLMAEGLDDGHLKSMLELFTETALEIGEGQRYDMDFEQRTDVREEEYIEMIRLKTSVLLACALKGGALLADAPVEDADNLYKFGEYVGLAFQLQDDYLDVYGDESVFGKAIGGDILSNKKTYLLINAQNKADEEQRKALMGWLEAADCDAQAKIAAVTKLYNAIGVEQLATAKIAECFERSKIYLDAVGLDEARKAELVRYVQKMMNRTY